MQLVTHQYCLKDLYSTSSKLFITEPDQDVFAKTFKITNEIDVYKFKYDRQSQQGTITFLKEELNNHKDSSLVTMELVSNFCLGLLVFSEAGKEDFKQLIDWWSKRSTPESTPLLLELDPERARSLLQAEFWQQIYVRTVRQTQTLADRISTLQKQYLGLRTLHENMQNAFAGVEDYLSQAKLPPLQLVFDNQPTEKSVEPSNLENSNSLELKQLLPISSRGLAVIELHVAKKHDNINGCLTVYVKAAEDQTCFAKWQINYQQLSEGWLSLDLPSIDLGRKQDVELVVEWTTKIGPAPSLSLGQLQSIAEVQAYSNEVALKHSLAFRIWNGLPGTRKVTSPYLLSINEQNIEAIHLGDLGQGAIANLQEVTPNLPTEKLAHIRVIRDGAKILTHPRANGTATIAMLPFCFPPGANHLTATVTTEHEQAGIIEYAMAIIAPGIDPQTCFQESLSLGFSGWVAVEPNMARQISVQLTSPQPEHCHIIVATRLAKDSVPYYAWAHWLNFCSSTQLKEQVISEQVISEQIISEQIIPEQILPEQILPEQILPEEVSEIETPQVVSLPQVETKLRDASLKLAQSTFVRVQELENQGKIQVHPRYNEETVAILSNAVASGTIAVKSTVCTENKKASVVEYAIAVIETDDDAGARLAVTSSESALGCSGWHRIEPNTISQLSLELPSPTTENCHLVLATRLPEDGIQRNAWARWLDFEYVSVVESKTLDLVGEQI
jgi:hypothetical protein